jgi:hypothetical protein
MNIPTLRPNTRILLLLTVPLATLAFSQCRPAAKAINSVRKSGDQSHGSGGHFTLSGDYGSLAYEGEAIRTAEQGKCVVRIPSLRLSFVPGAGINRTDHIDATEIRLVATKRPPSGDGSYSIIAADGHSLSVSLTAQSPTVTLTDIVLTVTSDDAAQADHLGLAVTDGKMLWPLGGELKQP